MKKFIDPEKRQTLSLETLLLTAEVSLTEQTVLNALVANGLMKKTESGYWIQPEGLRFGENQDSPMFYPARFSELLIITIKQLYAETQPTNGVCK